MHRDPTPHLLIPYASCSADAWLPTLQSMPPGSLTNLGRLLQTMKLTDTDHQAADTLSPPHERAQARALGLASADTPDGLIPWAARDAAQLQPAGPDKAWAWITPCHWAMGHLHATLSDPAALQLEPSDSRALLALMQPYFQTDGITLHYADALGPGRWLAEGEVFRGLPTASLDRVLARNVDAWLPGGRPASAEGAVGASVKILTRLQNEMQMLLYTHPFNDERLAQRQLPVNSFWISGTGSLPAGKHSQAPAPAPALVESEQVPASPPRSLAQAVFREDWSAYGQAWQALDAGELAELLQQQRAGKPVRLTLCGEQAALTFDTHRSGLLNKISSLFSPLRPLDLLRQL